MLDTSIYVLLRSRQAPMAASNTSLFKETLLKASDSVIHSKALNVSLGEIKGFLQHIFSSMCIS